MKSIHYARFLAQTGVFGTNSMYSCCFYNVLTGFQGLLARISTCVCIIHAVGNRGCGQQAIYQRKCEIALIQIRRFRTNSMYNAQVTRVICQFLAKSCFSDWGLHKNLSIACIALSALNTNYPKTLSVVSGNLVEHRGLEPLTSWLPATRSPN